jgi:hypothetical protein
MAGEAEDVVETHDPLAFLDEAEDTGGEKKPEGEQEEPAGDKKPEGADAEGKKQEEPADKKVEPDEDDPQGVTVDGKVMVPLSALLKERNKRQEKPAAPAAAAEEPVEVEIPDPATDPKGYFDYQQSVITTNIVNNNLNVSERFARKEHPAELVDAVRTWALAKFDTDPEYAKKVLFDADPYGVAIADYQAEQRGNKLQGLTDAEIDELIAIREGKGSTQTPAAGAAQKPAAEKPPAAQQKQDEAKPPRTIAEETNAGGKTVDTVAGPGKAFDSVFGE